MREVVLPTKEEKKRLWTDIIIICLVSFVALGIVLMLFNGFNDIAYDQSINVVLRTALIGFGGQFALAGLGMCIVCLIRKEKFTQFGLNTKNLIPALLLSLACCVPDFIYNIVNGRVHAWCPFIDVHITREVLASPIWEKIPGYLIIAICWGFFEGFNYVVINDKVSKLYPSKVRFWDWGAFSCAVMCILIHGAVGVTPDAILEMLCTMFLIYGMLIVRKETGNAWGCVLIFMVYWNAL